jgi:rod shape-determining protein MreC
VRIFRRYALLAAVVVVCLALLTAQTRGTGLGAPGDLVSLVFKPVQVLLVKLHRGALSIWTEYVEWKSARWDNARLRADNERLRVEALAVEETRQENGRLRRLLELRQQLPIATLSGEVIAREGGGWVRSLTVNRGRGDGVFILAPVIVPQGLVGRVIRVRAGASVVQLLNDPVSSVGALVQRTRTEGLVEGDAGGHIRFKFMARDGGGIAAGDLLVTSGAGSVFPRGLPIGRVRSVEDKGSALFHFAVLEPVVDFGRLQEVLLVTGQTTQDLAALFTRGG